MNDRILKVYESLNNHKYPKILLQGRWLMQAGFNIGEQVRVEVQKGILSISIIKNINP